MTTARDICNSVLRKVHVLGQGQIKPDAELNDVLENINDMLAMWSVEGNLVYTESSDTFNLTSGRATYTVGTSQDFDTDRILSITSAFVTQGSIDYRLKDYDQKQYAGISQKNITGIPELYYYNSDYPIADLSLYPAPSGGFTITINSQKPLTAFTDLNTTYNMPPEYRAAIIYNAAVFVAPEYEKEPTRAVMRMANRTKRAIETQNARNDRHVSTLGVPQREHRDDYNIYRGY